jgi:porphobilinogen synthase
MGFPVIRPRRLRASLSSRCLVRETVVTPADLVQPFFVCGGKNVRQPVASMPGVHRLSVDHLVKDARQAHQLGIPAVILFGVPFKKDPLGQGAYAKDGIVQRATEVLKNALPDLLVVTDLCLCGYTNHGHCGVLGKKFQVNNDATLDVLGKIGVSQARAGADWVAPSGMMDGAVGAIRRALDGAGFSSTAILSYAAKYASAFYGPFRDAADSAPGRGDRKSYQLDPANAGEALREVSLDIEEGADMVMVKPALAYLDIVRQVKEMSSVPVAAYNVSGEYAMVKSAAAKGWLEGRSVALEILTCIKRAGADVIVTYHATELAKSLS